MVSIVLDVNGTHYPLSVDPHESLLSAVRGPLGLTGAKRGCDDSECGACMMLIDGRPVNACSYLAVQADGRPVSTVEGLRKHDEFRALQDAILRCGGVQCGFCTPGMLISAAALLRERANPTVAEIRTALSGNLCRCTGYSAIVDAVASIAAREDEGRCSSTDEFTITRLE